MIALVRDASRLSPANLGYLQALVRGFYYFLGMVAGSLLGGWVSDRFGYVVLWRGAAAAAAVWTIAFRVIAAAVDKEAIRNREK